MRRNLFTRDDVVAAAVAVVRRHGFAHLSARRVARELGASTAPVYSNFANMDELAGAVRKHIAGLVLAETEVARSGEPFLDMGVGVLEFARRQPGLYRAVFGAADDGAADSSVAADAHEDIGRHVMGVLLERMARVESLSGLPPAERLILLRKMAIFTHGLAGQVSAGRADEHSWAEVLTLLAEAGRAMVTDAFNRPPRTEAEIALLAHLCERQPADPGAAGADEPTREDR